MNDTQPIPLTDEDYDRFDEQMPIISENATREAYERALQSGFPVTILENNVIVQITADGKTKELKKLPKVRKRVTQLHFTIP